MTDKNSKPAPTEVRAYTRGLHISPRKVRLVTNLLINKPVNQALQELKFVVKNAAHPVSKLIHSAIANASHNFQIEEDRLFIKRFSVDGGPVMKRFKPRAQGRAFPIHRRTSHLNLVLGVGAAQSSGKLVKPVVSSHAVDSPGKQTETSTSSKEQKKPSRLRFWQREKKSGKMSQLPPKQDPKGKTYTSFDRRGGE